MQCESFGLPLQVVAVGREKISDRSLAGVDSDAGGSSYLRMDHSIMLLSTQFHIHLELSLDKSGEPSWLIN